MASSSRIPSPNPVTVPFWIVTSAKPVFLMPTEFTRPAPSIVCPLRLTVIPAAPILMPSAQFVRSLATVVFELSVCPQTTATRCVPEGTCVAPSAAKPASGTTRSGSRRLVEGSCMIFMGSPFACVYGATCPQIAWAVSVQNRPLSVGRLGKPRHPGVRHFQGCSETGV